MLRGSVKSSKKNQLVNSGAGCSTDGPGSSTERSEEETVKTSPPNHRQLSSQSAGAQA